jgi:hypothetical protein
MAQGDSGGDTTSALDYMDKRLCNFCDQSKIYVQLMYDVAMLSGIRSLLSILSKSVGQGLTCVAGEDLQYIDYLATDIKGTIAQNMLKLYNGEAVDTDQLADKAVKMATEIGGLEHSLAYKIANCINTLMFKLDSCVATSNELRQLLAQLSKPQQSQPQQSQAQPSKPQQLGIENKNLKTKEQA